MPCVIARATMEVVKAGDTQIRVLSPAVLRQSLRKAGKLLKACEVAVILGYVISDEQFEELHNLYLAHLRTGHVTPGKASKKARWVPRKSSLHTTSALQSCWS